MATAEKTSRVFVLPGWMTIPLALATLATLAALPTACAPLDSGDAPVTGREKFREEVQAVRQERYVVLQTTAESASGELEQIINYWEREGYSLHTVIPKANVWGFVIVMERDPTPKSTPEAQP